MRFPHAKIVIPAEQQYTVGSSAEKREQLIRYIDGIEMYIEDSYAD